MRNTAVSMMKQYYGDQEKSIDHTLRVMSFSEQIMDGEQIRDRYVRDVVILATAFHDVGIPAARKKFGTVTHQAQEAEGHPIARSLMLSMGVRSDVLERVCYIVGNHHTLAAVDGLDFQVMWEADALVNIPARREAMSPEQRGIVIAENFKTATGQCLVEGLI